MLMSQFLLRGNDSFIFSLLLLFDRVPCRGEAGMNGMVLL